MFKEVLKTLLMCGICCAVASAIVFPLWPLVSGHLKDIPPWLPPKFAMLGGIAVFVVITHMQRGQLDPMRAPFKLLYGAACVMFAASTIPPSQYNAGTAVTEVAFVLMLLWKIFRKEEAKRDVDTPVEEEVAV